MSSSKRLARLGFLLLALAGPIGLAGCTLSPVYSGRVAEQASVQLAYGKPASRIEQIIYQDLALRFMSTDSETAPLATINASTSSRSMALSQTVNPSKPYEVTVTASLTITPRAVAGQKPIVLTRQASASYTTNSQVLADTEAANAASERAAHAAAESLRLAVLATLAH